MSRSYQLPPPSARPLSLLGCADAPGEGKEQSFTCPLAEFPAFHRLGAITPLNLTTDIGMPLLYFLSPLCCSPPFGSFFFVLLPLF
jgi:hypothetical protein